MLDKGGAPLAGVIALRRFDLDHLSPKIG